MTEQRRHKTDRAAFVRANPFPRPLTEGFFYREKMRAIHRVAPDGPLLRILEIGGGRSALTSLLYPHAGIVNLDIDPDHGRTDWLRQHQVRFVCADATRLPFGAHVFDAVTMFDVLEHIPDDAGAARDALRVLRPGGVVLLTTPNEDWRFPYYGAFRRFCPTDAEVMADWGHVRRGYEAGSLDTLFGATAEARANFISPITVVGHDLAFSSVPPKARRALCAIAAPASWAGYAMHGSRAKGTETAYRWRKT